MFQLYKNTQSNVIYELAKKPVQLSGMFGLYVNGFHLLAEILCHQAETLSRLQMQVIFLQNHGIIYRPIYIFPSFRDLRLPWLQRDLFRGSLQKLNYP